MHTVWPRARRALCNPLCNIKPPLACFRAPAPALEPALTTVMSSGLLPRARWGRARLGAKRGACPVGQLPPARFGRGRR